MLPRGDHPPFLKHDDAVRVLQGGETLGDDEGGPAFAKSFHRLLDQPLRLRVHARRGVVQNQHARIHQERARDGDALALAAAERHAALANDRVVAVRQLADEFMRLRRARAFFNLRPRRLRPTVGDVLSDRRAEQESLLKNHAHRPPQLRQVQLLRIHAVEQHASLRRVVEARDQVHERGLARARRPDDRDGLAWMHGKAHFVQDWSRGRGRRAFFAVLSVLGFRRLRTGVFEADLVEDHFTATGRHGTGSAFQGRGLFENFQHALRAGAGVLHDVRELADHADAMPNRHQVEHDLRQIAEQHLALDDLSSANPQRERRAETVEELRARNP